MPGLYKIKREPDKPFRVTVKMASDHPYTHIKFFKVMASHGFTMKGCYSRRKTDHADIQTYVFTK